jgi:hypothetical protein
MTIIHRCERCEKETEVSSFPYKDRSFFLCDACSVHLEAFGAHQLRLEHYANRGGLIYGSPWWKFNKLTEEDKEWELQTFGEDDANL